MQYAGVAQSVVQLIRNQQVVCSSHITSSKKAEPSLGFFVCPNPRDRVIHNLPKSLTFFCKQLMYARAFC